MICGMTTVTYWNIYGVSLKLFTMISRSVLIFTLKIFTIYSYNQCFQCVYKKYSHELYFQCVNIHYLGKNNVSVKQLFSSLYTK